MGKQTPLIGWEANFSLVAAKELETQVAPVYKNPTHQIKRMRSLKITEDRTDKKPTYCESIVDKVHILLYHNALSCYLLIPVKTDPHTHNTNIHIQRHIQHYTTHCVQHYTDNSRQHIVSNTTQTTVDNTLMERSTTQLYMMLSQCLRERKGALVESV